MTSSQARRVQLSGIQLKEKFLIDYTQDGLINPELISSLWGKTTPATFSIKVGMNWQFKLGRFDELEEIGYNLINKGKTVSFTSKREIVELFYEGLMFRKYAFKESIFICRADLKWVLFNSQEIIEYVIANINVRILESGRIKVDLMDVTTGKYRAIFTFEYRAEHHKKSFVFGAHGGGAGKRLYEILRNNCNYELLNVFKRLDM